MVQQWREVYQAVLLERDVDKRHSALDAAERATKERLREMRTESLDLSEERQELDNAIHNLRMLRKETDKKSL